MSALNSFIKSIAILIIFFFIVIGSVYILIIAKPESIIFVTNKLLNEDYSIEFKEVKSDTNFLYIWPWRHLSEGYRSWTCQLY